MYIYIEKTLEKEFAMITKYFQASHRGFSFSALVEKISNAMTFLDPADVGPWTYK